MDEALNKGNTNSPGTLAAGHVGLNQVDTRASHERRPLSVPALDATTRKTTKQRKRGTKTKTTPLFAPPGRRVVARHRLAHLSHADQLVGCDFSDEWEARRYRRVCHQGCLAAERFSL